jgi:tetratricopeptide (TPR) repeat protein
MKPRSGRGNVQRSTFNVQRSTKSAVRCLAWKSNVGRWTSSLKSSAVFLLLSAFLACSSFAALATTSEAVFEDANRLYDQGKFAEAAGAYSKLIEQGSAPSALYFNLGNASFKSGQVGRAIAAYREAERLSPRDPDVRANLQHVRDQVQGPTLRPHRAQRWLGRLAANEWTVAAAGALWLALLLAGAIQFRPTLKPKLRGLILLSGLAAIPLIACAGLALSQELARNAVVIAREAPVRNGPLDESQTSFTVHDGAELRILDQKNDWLQVTADGTRIGWIKAGLVLVHDAGRVERWKG